VISCLIFAATCRIADGFLGWPGGLHPGGGTSRRSLATSRVRSTKRSQFDDEGASVKCGGVCEGDERSQRELAAAVVVAAAAAVAAAVEVAVGYLAVDVAAEVADSRIALKAVVVTTGP